MENIEITDKELYELCKKYGTAARLWRQKFIGLLPEVDRRRLYATKGFPCISVFAAKLCGVSSKQVRLALNLGKRLNDKPILRKMFEEGEVSINKLARIISIITPENEAELAEKLKVLSKSALDTFVRDIKIEINENGLQRLLFDGKNLPGQTAGAETDDGLEGMIVRALVNDVPEGLHVQTEPARDVTSKSPPNHTKPLFGSLPGQTFELADDVKEQLNELQSKGIDVNELLRKFLKQRKEEIEKKKEEIVREIQDEQKEGNDARGEQGTSELKSKSASRYIPAKIKKIIKEEHGTKCSIPTCQKPAEVIHHTQTFGLSHTHDPRFMAPLCREHHVIAHSMDIKYHKIRNTCSG